MAPLLKRRLAAALQSLRRGGEGGGHALFQLAHRHLELREDRFGAGEVGLAAGALDLNRCIERLAHPEIADGALERVRAAIQLVGVLMLDRLARAAGVRTGALLDLGCATGYLLEVARQRGFDPFGVELNRFSAKLAQEKFGATRIHCGTLDDAPFAPASFRAVVMSDLLEHVRSPRKLLAQAHRLLTPGGALIVVAPDVGGLSSKLLRTAWTDYKREHLFYFDRKTLKASLRQAGFEVRQTRAFPKFLDLSYIRQQLVEFPTPLFTPLIRGIHALLPERATRIAFPIFAGSMIAVAVRT